jgi:hypothetical protein
MLWVLGFNDGVQHFQFFLEEVKAFAWQTRQFTKNADRSQENEPGIIRVWARRGRVKTLAGYDSGEPISVKIPVLAIENLAQILIERIQRHKPRLLARRSVTENVVPTKVSARHLISDLKKGYYFHARYPFRFHNLSQRIYANCITIEKNHSFEVTRIFINPQLKTAQNGLKWFKNVCYGIETRSEERQK